MANKAKNEGKPSIFPSKRKLDFARLELEKGFEYIVDNKNVVRLKDIRGAVEKRIQNINQNNRKALLSVDKGQGWLFSYTFILG